MSSPVRIASLSAEALPDTMPPLCVCSKIIIFTALWVIVYRSALNAIYPPEPKTYSPADPAAPSKLVPADARSFPPLTDAPTSESVNAPVIAV
jgi:hypothetical protein